MIQDGTKHSHTDKTEKDFDRLYIAPNGKYLADYIRKAHIETSRYYIHIIQYSHISELL